MKETTIRRLILAGGSGFLGQALVKEFAGQGAELINTFLEQRVWQRRKMLDCKT